MNHVLIVAAGGALGASARHLVNQAGLRLLGPGFPWSTLAVNLVGCLAMGVLVEWLARRTGGSTEIRLFAATGILGGFTTFSAFSLDFTALWERGESMHAVLYVAGSVLGSLIAVFVGMAMVRAFA